MCISQLVIQDWCEKFAEILENSNIKHMLRAIYVDDGRLVMRKLGIGMRFVTEKNI